MDISKIVSVSGHGGLFEVISQIKNGIIVEGLEDKKRMPVYASQKVVALEDISIYTYEEDIPLKDVLLTIHDQNKGEAAPDTKASPDDLKAFMEKMLPDYDKDRVYVSDLKKLMKWYNILNENGLITKEEEAKEEVAEAEKEETKAEPKEEAKAAKQTKSKAKPAAEKKTAAPKKTTKSKPAKKGE